MAMKHLLLAVAVLLPLASACIVSKVDVALAMPAMSGNLSADAYDAVSSRSCQRPRPATHDFAFN